MESRAQPERFVRALADGEIAGLHWAREGAPRLLFCHATGFCASAYKQMLSFLSAEFDVFAVDLRGHGRTSLQADPDMLDSWRVYGRDIAAFLDIEGRGRGAGGGWTLAGHSLGAVTAAKAARDRDDVSALCLIEPVVILGPAALVAKTPLWPWLRSQAPLARKAARRRAHWASRDKALAVYGRKALFAGWAPGVLADYLEDGLRPAGQDEGEGWDLSCAPAWEAATFAAAPVNNAIEAIGAAPAPVSVLLCDDRSSTASPRARRRLAAAGAHIKLSPPGMSHLAPMEAPQYCAQFILNSARP